MAYCGSCGSQIDDNIVKCPTCGEVTTAAQQAASEQDGPVSTKGFVPALLLCLFLGVFGIHRFYVGKVGTGILMILTLGGLGIWQLIDLILIAVGSFKDAKGLPLAR